MRHRLQAHLYAIRLVVKLRFQSKRTGVPFEVLLAHQLQTMQLEAERIVTATVLEAGEARLQAWRDEAARQAERN